MQDLMEQLKRESERMNFSISCIEDSPEMYQETVKTHAKIGDLLLRMSDKNIGKPHFEMKESAGAVSVDIKEDEVDVYLPYVVKISTDNRAARYRPTAKMLKKKYLSTVGEKLSEYTSPHYGEKYVFWFQFNGWSGDVDNLEVKILIDSIAGHFVPDDMGSYVSIYRTASPERELGTTLRIMPESRFKKEVAR